jgi:hypothetical protein
MPRESGRTDAYPGGGVAVGVRRIVRRRTARSRSAIRSRVAAIGSAVGRT